MDTTNVLDDKGKPVQDAWADTPPTPKVDEKGQPVLKQQDRVVTKEDLANKDVPLPADMAEGDPYPVLQKDADGKLVLKDGKAIASAIHGKLQAGRSGYGQGGGRQGSFDV